MILDRKGEIENMMLICAEDGEKRSALVACCLLLVACGITKHHITGTMVDGVSKKVKGGAVKPLKTVPCHVGLGSSSVLVEFWLPLKQ